MWFCGLLQSVEAGDVPGQRTRGHGVGAAEPGLARAGPPRKIPVDRGDADLVLARGLAGTAVVAGAAAGRDDLSADRLEGLQIPLRAAVFANIERTELEEQARALGDAHAMVQPPFQDLVIEVEIITLGRGAGSGVGDIDRHTFLDGFD